MVVDNYDSISDNIVVVDIIDDTGVADDEEKLLELDYVFDDKESIETYAKEAEPQESLSLVVPPPKPEFLPDQEDATFMFSKPLGTFQHDKVSISYDLLENFMKLLFIDVIDCDLLLDICSTKTDFVPFFSYLICVREVFSFPFYRFSEWILQLNRF